MFVMAEIVVHTFVGLVPLMLLALIEPVVAMLVLLGIADQPTIQ